jgi:hypothetical protein
LFYSLFVIAVVGALIFWHKRWLKTPLKDRKLFAQRSLLWGLVGFSFALVIFGRAHWLMGVLAALLALIARLAQFAQYLPFFRKLFDQDPLGSTKGSSKGSTNGDSSPPANQGMSRQQAADILGVDANASKEEIRLAHKKLMQKIHPDRGGSDGLAKQINHAKTTLLS